MNVIEWVITSSQSCAGLIDSVAAGAFFTLFIAEPSHLLSDLPRYPEHIDSSIVCLICDKEKDRSKGNLLECEKCDQPYHPLCLNPPLTVVPEGEWFCPECKKEIEVEEAADEARAAQVEQNLRRKKKEREQAKAKAITSASASADANANDGQANGSGSATGNGRATGNRGGSGSGDANANGHSKKRSASPRAGDKRSRSPSFEIIEMLSAPSKRR